MFRTERRTGTHPAAAASHATSPLLAGPGIALFVLAQLADLVTFLMMIELRGVVAEANPIVVAFLDVDRLGLLIAAKIAVWAVALSCAALLARRTPRLAEFVVVFGIAAGLFGAFSNLITL
ncbi:MAG: hypothetical protein ACRDGL_09730 [Candidatus Limnocylindrales bacterium]